MRKMMRLEYLIIIFVLAFTMSCTSTTTERTTSTMSTDSETTTVITTNETTTTTETTTEEIVPIAFDRIELVNEVIQVDQMLEFDIFEDSTNLLIAQNYNPYDYNEIELRFHFTKPSGESFSQTGFWIREYEEVKLIGGQMNEEGFYTDGQEYVTWKSDIESHYRVRINPDEAGIWSYSSVITIKGVITQTLTGEFTVQDAEQRSDGYIQVDKANNRNFIFTQSVETYVPNGLNLAWYSTTLATHDYYNWFKKLNENNANMARIWLSNWSYSLHKFSYTNFDSRQNILARLDYLFATAKEFDVYILLTLLNHGQFSAITNPEWAENPYNQENGGMLEYPIQFFYNDEAIEAYQNELMYLISRFGYSENIFAWELFNETDWVDGYSELVVTRWKDTMAKFLHENDPYNHMVTTSYKYTWGTAGFNLDSLDFATFHSYDYADKLYSNKMVDELTSLWDKYEKPVIFGEIGIDWQAGQSTYSSDYTGITIHQGMWTGIMTGAGGANQWWWDTWIDAHNLWYRMLGASTYATYIDVAGKDYQLIQEIDNVTTSDDDIHVIGYLLDDTIYGYIYNELWNY